MRTILINGAMLAAAGALCALPAIAGGDGEEGPCLIRKVTPNWQPGTEGEWGDTMGLLAISGDGQWVAYSSYTTLFLPNASEMHGHLQQIIVRNSDTQEGELISAAYNPKPGETIAANAHCEWYLDMSPNGRYVAFASLATNLVAPEYEVTGEFFQTFVRDREEGVTHLVSVSMKGQAVHDWGSDVRLGVSDCGKVAFASRANNIHPDQPNTMWAVYVRDIHAGTTELISRDNLGNPAVIDAYGPSISADGNTVAFISQGALTAEVNWNSHNVFVRDRALQKTELVSKDANGDDRPGAGYFPRLSADGSRVAFRFDTFAPPLDPEFPSGYADVIYVRDRANNRTVGISKTWENQPATPSPEGGFTISADGRFVAWETIDQVTEEDPINPIWHVYRTHIDTLESDLVTVDRQCQPIPEMHDQMYSAISGDGNHVVFNSMWHVLGEPDFDWSRHLYVWSDPDVSPKCAGPYDLNCDGEVDFADLLILLAAWGPCPDECPADFNGDGIVDFADLLEMLSNWGGG